MLKDLLHLLQLEKIESNIYRGPSRDIGSPQVFGGQVLGQALSAAQKTVEDRVAHSLHAYFLRRGDVDAPIVYEVDRQRDGRSFSMRRVVAIQHGRPIFNMAASFQLDENGLEHQAEMPRVPGPEGLASNRELSGQRQDVVPERMRRFLTRGSPFEFRPVKPEDYLSSKKSPPFRHTWLRITETLPDDPDLHRNLLAYVSDFELLGTATLPHGLPFGQGQVQLASIDHALWFHRPARLDEWLLCGFDSPNASGARGFSRAQYFSRDGILVASSSQEGVMRVWDKSRQRRGTIPSQQD